MSELYPGHKVLESYFKEKGHFASYYGFLLLHQNTIVASSLPTNNWKELNNRWTNRFLKEAKYYEKDLISIKEKTYKEQTRYTKELENYWKEVITKSNKDSVNQKLEEKDSIKRKLGEEKENFNLQSKNELKSLIQKEKHNDFAGIDPDQLKLWQVEIPDDCYDELVKPQLHGNNELLGTKKISKYFTKAPVDEHIHIIVSLPETTKTRQELINKVAELQKLLKRSIYGMFHVIAW
ncbi:unnamed protein product [Rhizophagus irregularis]|nr:unnamed protein product [Rhizophagus irregularis]